MVLRRSCGSGKLRPVLLPTLKTPQPVADAGPEGRATGKQGPKTSGMPQAKAGAWWLFCKKMIHTCKFITFVVCLAANVTSRGLSRYVALGDIPMHSHSSMNRVYRIVWNDALSMWVAVAENAKGRSKGGTGRKRLAALLAAALGTAAGMVPPAMAGPLDAIATDGRTATQLNLSSANTVNITTTTLSGNNAFNSFSRFGVDAGNTANLHVPTGATNLINIVRDARTDINGVLNGIQDGRIGGNVWFANPYGLVVGAGGVVNVGSLNVSTPTAAFVQGFFGANGPNANSVQQLLGGTAPLNANGTVSIQGRVNAINGVMLSAGAINVSGSIYSGARFVARRLTSATW